MSTNAKFQLQYRPLGKGYTNGEYNAPWQVWGLYTTSKKDAKEYKEDVEYLKDKNMIRTVYENDPHWIT